MSKETRCAVLRNHYTRCKQAPRAWYQRVDKFFLNIGFKRCASNANLYVYRKDGKYVVVVLYVDDLIITGDHEEMIQQTKKALSAEFEMTDSGSCIMVWGLMFSNSHAVSSSLNKSMLGRS